MIIDCPNGGAKEHVLPRAYVNTEIEKVENELTADCEISRWLATEERRRGKRPTALFLRVREFPGHAVLGNPYTRRVLFAALNLDRHNWQAEIARRLSGQPFPVRSTEPRWERLSSLRDVPALRHRPGDAGPYITSGVTVSRRSNTTDFNVGVYRIQVVEGRYGRIFLDPRTDGFRNWQNAVKVRGSMPVSVFIGGNPAYMLAAASRLPSVGNDFEIISKLLGHALETAGDPPVPVDASYALFGEITDRLEMEGPFAEFKGYYVGARPSPVLEINSAYRLPGSVYPTIVTGAESGLTLMALQNEYLLYSHLTHLGHSIRSVHYPLAGLGEFVTLVESDLASPDLLEIIMRFDTRTKIVICGRRIDGYWQSLSTNSFKARPELYIRKGNVEGDRIGILLDPPSTARRAEY
jgi:UbiD family decarboxylase